MTENKIVDFENPPVVEVVCGVAFSQLDKLMNYHCLEFSSALSEEFTEIDEVDQILPPAEFGAPQEWPLMPRYWFSTSDHKKLVQVQKDRFLFNWRRMDGEAKCYPEFVNILPEFSKWFAEFQNYTSSKELGSPDVRQLELSYINHIEENASQQFKKEGFSSVLVDHQFCDDHERFLPSPKVFRWVTNYDIPNLEGILYVTVLSGEKKETKEKLLRLDLTVKGITSDTSTTGIETWFNDAHDYIVRSLVDITNDHIQDNVWKRK